MKHKIFLGLDDVSSSITDMSQLFKDLGHDTLTAINKQHSALDQCKVDHNFANYPFKEFASVKPTRLKLWMQSRFNMPGKIFRKAIKECDTFIFLWDSFQWDMSDYAYLKSKGKKIISIFCGNEVRWHYSCKQEFEHYGLRELDFGADYNYGTSHLNLKLRKLRVAEKYSDIVVSRVDQAQLALRPYYRWHMFIIPERLKFNPTQRQTNPIVAHAPSSRSMKGTKYVLEAFERLKQEGIEFTPLLIEKMPNQEMLEKLSDIDIVIDQLIIPGTGKLASEALAAGCVVMSLMAYETYPQKNSLDCPVIDVNPDTIYAELKKIILDHKKRSELPAKGLAYVNDHISYKKFCQKLIDILDEKKNEYDYTPDFFRSTFIPESKEAEKLYNDWTKTVMDCDWYQHGIKKGERAGLIF